MVTLVRQMARAARPTKDVRNHIQGRTIIMAMWIKKWNVEGSTGNTYVVSQDENGEFGCSCPVWTFRRKVCKHIIWLKDQLPGLKPSTVSKEAKAAKKEKDAVKKAMLKLHNDPSVPDWF